MAAITLFHADKCCHLVSEHKSCAGAYAATSISARSIVFVLVEFVAVVLNKAKVSRPRPIFLTSRLRPKIKL